MKRLARLSLALAMFAWAAPSIAAFLGAGGIWAMRKGDFVATNFAGTESGLQSAASFASPGGQVQIAGRISVANTIRISASGVSFIGLGDSTVVENASASGDTLIVVSGTGCTIRDMVFDGNRGAKSSGIAIYDSGARLTVRNCAFVQMPQGAVVVAAPNATVENCRFINGAGTGLSAVAGADSLRAVNNTISGTVGSPGYGLLLSGVRGFTVSGNQFSNTRETALWATGARYGIVSENRVHTTFNTDEVYVGGGMAFDSTCFGNVVTSNLIMNPKGMCIEADGDSSVYSSNVTIGGASGVHIHQGVRGSRVTNNIISRPTGYGIYAEYYGSSSDTTGSGDDDNVIAGNSVFDPGYNCLHLEANTVPHFRVDVHDNYFYGGKTASLSAIRVLCVNGSWRGVSIRNNHIYKPARDGIEFIHTSGLGNISDAVVVGNEIIDAGRYGIETETWPSGTSSAYISGNVIIRPALGEMNLGSNWNYENTAEVTTRATKIVSEDSLRVTGQVSIGQKNGIPNVVSIKSAATGTASDSSVIVMDGTINGSVASPLIRFRRGGGEIGYVGASNYALGFKVDASRFFGFGLLGAGVGAYNSAAYDGGARWNLGGAGDPGSVALKVTGRSRTTGLASADSAIWSGGSIAASDTLIAGGPLIANGKGTVLDSLRVVGNLAVGRKSGVPTTFSMLGAPYGTAGDSVSFVLDGTSTGSVFGPVIRIRRAGAEKGAIGASTTVWGVKTDSTAAFGFGWLGSAAGQWASVIFGGGKNFNINGTSNPTPYNLKVSGAAIVTDSLRVPSLMLTGVPYASLGTAVMGALKYCTDCTAANPTAGGGTGHVVVYTGSQWNGDLGAASSGAISGSAAHDFDLSAAARDSFNITVTGAVAGHEVALGVDAAVATTPGILFTAAVTATNTVTVYAWRQCDAVPNPPSGTFRVRTW